MKHLNNGLNGPVGFLGRCWIEIGERASFLRMQQMTKESLWPLGTFKLCLNWVWTEML